MRALMVMLCLAAAPLLAQSPVSGVWPVKPVAFVDLAYPPDALEARVIGTVVVRVGTDPSGRVVSADVISGSSRLAPAVVANVRQWVWSPGARSEVIVYRFEIDGASCNDDLRSLFRLPHPNLAVVTTCTSPRRAGLPPPPEDLVLASWGSPIYPDLAFSARITGIVVLEVSVDSNGKVVDSRPLTELPLVTAAAVAHSRTWRFRPSDRRRGIIVYEFAQDKRSCGTDSPMEFWQVGANFWRLSACSPFIGGG